MTQISERAQRRLRSSTPAICVIVLAVTLSTALDRTALAATRTFRCRPQPSRPPATVLVLHPGAFIWDYDSFPDVPDRVRRHRAHRACDAFARQGFLAEVYAYPLGDYRAAVRAVRREAASLARNGTTVYAYGESAGGTLAEILALRHQVAAAVAVAGISDLGTWQPHNDAYWRRTLHLSLCERRKWSPIRMDSDAAAPLLLLHSRDDTVVPFAQSARLNRRDPSSRLEVLEGDHLKDRRALRLAQRFLDAQDAHRRRP